MNKVCLLCEHKPTDTGYRNWTQELTWGPMHSGRNSPISEAMERKYLETILQGYRSKSFYFINQMGLDVWTTIHKMSDQLCLVE